MSQKMDKRVVVVGTGGTIAGSAASASDNIGYRAAEIGVGQLLDALPGLTEALGGCQLVSEQVAQIDSKDMSLKVWHALANRVQYHLALPQVEAVVITHGTDTLEETAFFLHCVLPAELINAKPVVLTCAMRPASSRAPDGPQNLLDATAVALAPGAHGVVVVCAGMVHSAADVQKAHTYRLDAFTSGDAGALACVEEGRVRQFRAWPSVAKGVVRGALDAPFAKTSLPRVEIVTSHAGASGAMIDALVLNLPGAQPLAGIVVAATGNGTMHSEIEEALRRAQARGIRVVRSTRCANGQVLPTPDAEFDDSAGLSPVKARIALMLELAAA